MPDSLYSYLYIDLELFVISRLSSLYMSLEVRLTLREIRNWHTDLKTYLIAFCDLQEISESGILFIGTIFDVSGDGINELHEIRNEFRRFNVEFPHKGETFSYKTRLSSKKGFHLVLLTKTTTFNTLR